MRAAGMIFAFAASVAPLSAETFESGESQTTLVELYTSEGCSSCPPAEERLAKLRDDTGLWKDIVPVAFHVDYWDGLGWPDRYARPEFTQRQRDYAARWKAPSIYTPDFVANGRDGRLAPPASPVGRLRAQVGPSGEVVITFRPARPVAGPLVGELAPLAGGIVSEVRRGENAGRRLAHEFIALALLSAPLESKNDEWTARLSLPPHLDTPISAVAAWVHAAGDPTPIQATGGWLKN